MIEKIIEIEIIIKQELKAHPAHKVQLVHKAHQVLMEPMELTAHRVNKEYKVHEDLMERMVLMVQMLQRIHKLYVKNVSNIGYIF